MLSDKTAFDAVYYTVSMDALRTRRRSAPKKPSDRARRTFYQTMTAQDVPASGSPQPEEPTPLGNCTARPAAPVRPETRWRSPQDEYRPETAAECRRLTVPADGGRRHCITPPAAADAMPGRRYPDMAGTITRPAGKPGAADGRA
ncbi:MAG: hypothetical protein ACLU38_15815 [Dysosmobacter sp.]